MCFEVFLELVLIIFAVFGLFSLTLLIGESCFRSDKVVLALRVDEGHVAKELALYVKEARSSWFLRGKSPILVILKREYATEDLLGWLKKEKLAYIVEENGKEEPNGPEE